MCADPTATPRSSSASDPPSLSPGMERRPVGACLSCMCVYATVDPTSARRRRPSRRRRRLRLDDDKIHNCCSLGVVRRRWRRRQLIRGERRWTAVKSSKCLECHLVEEEEIYSYPRCDAEIESGRPPSSRRCGAVAWKITNLIFALTDVLVRPPLIYASRWRLAPTHPPQCPLHARPLKCGDWAPTQLFAFRFVVPTACTSKSACLSAVLYLITFDRACRPSPFSCPSSFAFARSLVRPV